MCSLLYIPGFQWLKDTLFSLHLIWPFQLDLKNHNFSYKSFCTAGFFLFVCFFNRKKFSWFILNGQCFFFFFGQARRRNQMSGLGARGANIAADVGDSYRDALKKTMFARYNEADWDMCEPFFIGFFCLLWYCQTCPWDQIPFMCAMLRFCFTGNMGNSFQMLSGSKLCCKYI